MSKYYINDNRIGYIWGTVEHDVKTGESKSNVFFPLMPEGVTWMHLPMEQYNDDDNVTIYADLRDFYPGARL